MNTYNLAEECDEPGSLLVWSGCLCLIKMSDFRIFWCLFAYSSRTSKNIRPDWKWWLEVIFKINVSGLECIYSFVKAEKRIHAQTIIDLWILQWQNKNGFNET
jgi:hypothetical protein